jgi:tetratricopeptide (TPR) repeat protein
MTIMSCAGGAPIQTPSAVPLDAVRISSVAILSLPSKEVPANTQEMIWLTLANSLYRHYQVQVLAGRTLEKTVWKSADLHKPCRDYLSRLAEAKSAFRQLRINNTLDQLAEAETLLLVCEADVDPKALIELYQYKGLALLSKEREKEAMRAFRQVISFNQHAQLPSFIQQQSIQDAFEKARRQLLSGHPTRVNIQSSPNKAMVHIDGRHIGSTPIKGTPLYPGRHFVRIGKPGSSTWSKNLPNGVPPQSLQALLVKEWSYDPPKDLLDNARKGYPIEGDALTQLNLLARFYNVDAVLLVEPSHEGKQVLLRTQLYVLRNGYIGKWKWFDIGINLQQHRKQIKKIVRAYPVFKKK